jgi:hypothetical protein
MYPNSIFPVNPSRLIAVTQHLMYMFMAYPKIKAKLDSIKELDLLPRFEAWRQDLVFLFEFAIPVVNVCYLLERCLVKVSTTVSDDLCVGV